MRPIEDSKTKASAATALALTGLTLR
jgi:hypothetical protein